MSALERDIEAARHWLVGAGSELAGLAMAENAHVSYLLSKVELLAACAGLPGDAPLRVRCASNVFNFKA